MCLPHPEILRTDRLARDRFDSGLMPPVCAVSPDKDFDWTWWRCLWNPSSFDVIVFATTFHGTPPAASRSWTVKQRFRHPTWTRA